MVVELHPAGGGERTHARTHAAHLNAATLIFWNLRILMMLNGDKPGWRELSLTRHQGLALTASLSALPALNFACLDAVI